MSVWDKLFKDGSKKTMKSLRNHGSLKRKTLSDYTKKTLGTGNLKKAVQLPADGEYSSFLLFPPLAHISLIDIYFNIIYSTTIIIILVSISSPVISIL